MKNLTTLMYLTPQDLHQRWGFHRESIRRIIREGRVPALRIGKRLRVALSDVEAYENECRLRRYRTKEVAS